VSGNSQESKLMESTGAEIWYIVC